MKKKNITFSADSQLIEKAREKALKTKTTLNQAFREWLTQYADNSSSEANYYLLMDRLNYAKPGRIFSRDELNER